MVVMQFLLPLILIISPAFAQQISNGGLFRVPADQRYRDPKTRAAIFRVSRFATAFQPLQDMRAERNRLVEESRMSGSRSFKVSQHPIYLTNPRGISLPPAMDPLYYIQVGDIHPLEENRLRILIDWGGLKGLGRKGLKDLKGSKQGVKARQKDQNVAMVSSSCSRSQLLQLWRTRKRPQRPKKVQQERWPPKRISEGWSSAKRAVAKLREKGFNRWSAVRPASSEWVEIEEEEPLPEYKHSPPIDAPAASYNQKFYLSLPRYESFV